MKHLCLVAAGSTPIEDLTALLDPLPEPLAVSAHRRLRGPYTAAGAVLREWMPEILATQPDLAQSHDLEILAAAPELGSVLTSQRDTQTSTASPESRTRYYSRAHTLRLGHGITSLIKTYLTSRGEQRTLLVDRVDEADGTDLEWLAAMVRRIDPLVLRIVLRTAGVIPDPLRAAVLACADRIEVPVEHPETGPPTDIDGRAARYIAGDCVDEDPRAQQAYDLLEPHRRAALHDARAAALAARDEVSLRLGALVFHRVRGSDHAAALDAVDFALEYHMMQGFYTALVEWGDVLRTLVTWEEDFERRWIAVAKMTTALPLLGDPDRALTLYDEACAATTSPGIHMQAAYGRAIIFTRHLQPEQQDLLRARSCINTAIVIADASPNEKRRAYNVTFQENGLALIAMRSGDLETSLRLVEDGLRRLADELTTDEQGQHPSVLRHNRGQLLARMGRTVQAVEQYNELLSSDPNQSDYYFERAPLLRRLGDDEAALRDYDTVVRLALPYPESYYNRGDLRADLGDHDGALADFGMVLELEPTYLDAWVNRAALRYATGDLIGATADVAAGLALDPAQPQLLSLHGVLALDDGRVNEAQTAFEAAILADPGLAAAWANLGVLAHQSGDLVEAVRYYDRSLALADDTEVSSNRKLATASLGDPR